MSVASSRAGQGQSAVARRLDVLVLFVLALTVNGLAAVYITQPGYTDAYYYFGGARQLASGNGFSEPYIWNYLILSRTTNLQAWLWPSHLYWMPLVSIVGAPFVLAAQRLGGGTLSNAALFRVAQFPFILLASAVPLLSYAVAWLVSGARRHAISAALLTLFSPFYFAYWTTTDAFALYALTAAGALVMTALAASDQAHPGRWLFGAGLAAGLAHLTRADGVLLLACLLVWVVLRPAAAKGWRGRLFAVGGLVLGYLVVMGPWFWRNWVAIGAPLAPGSTRTLWLTNYDDIFSFSLNRLSPTAYFASGLVNILSGKWSALVANVQSLVAVQCGLVAFPFVLAGLWRLRQSALMQLAALYGAALLAVMTLLFTFPGERGGYFHSGAALLPFLMPAGVVGLDVAVEAAARTLRHWQPERSKPIFAGLLVACAVGLTLVVFWKRVIGPDPSQTAWAESEEVYGEVGIWLKAQGQDRVLAAVNDPPGWYYWTSLPAIVIPNDNAAVLRQAMITFGARWLVLDANRPTALRDLYAAPDSQPAFHLRARFTDSSGQPAYLFELGPGQ